MGKALIFTEEAPWKSGLFGRFLAQKYKLQNEFLLYYVSKNWFS